MGLSLAESTFAQRLEQHGARIAIIAGDGTQWSYGDLAQRADQAAGALCGAPAPVIVEAANTVDCIVAYLACLRARYPVLLAEPGSTARDPRIADTFGAAYVFRRSASGLWQFEPYAAQRVSVSADLCVLLSTSGSTGSPKLVRLSHANIDSNAASICAYLGISADDRALTALPAFYSYGMSVINSHLHAGACLLLTEDSVAQDSFWLRAERERATSFAGVPFTFEILERIGFRSRRYPHLRYLSQAGGRLSPEMVKLYAEWAESTEKQFFVMYGQTEAAPRMAYVPPAQLSTNTECIGVPIPGGSFALLGADGTPETRPNQPGELIYRGPNVMMGYAERAADLALGKVVDELHTGDLACRKTNGFYYIAGRMSRFVKIVGKRISLDEVERWLEEQRVAGAVGGNDEVIAVAVTRQDNLPELKQRLLQRFGLPAIAVEVATLDPLPTLASGKIDHRSVLRLVREAARRQAAPHSLRQGFAEILGIDAVRETDSFVDLGGDSVCFVEVSLLLEEFLGYVPDNWEALSIAALEALRQPARPAPAANDPAPVRKRSSFRIAAAVAIGLLLAGEGALQLRAYMKTGRSAAALLTNGSTVVFNAKWGVPTYRPNHVLPAASQDMHFQTNSLGLRSPEIRPERARGELRLAVVGASTVAGAYAKRNSDTFPSLLESRLRKSRPQQAVNVINAGVEGHTIVDSSLLIEHALVAMHPMAIIVYPGLNDITGICHAARARTTPARMALPAPAVPRWVLTGKLLAKNTVSLREPAIKAKAVDPSAYFPTYYADTLRDIVRKLRASGIEPVLMTVARAFDGSSREQGMPLAETALYYNSCLDYDGLVNAGKMYNQAISSVAEHEHVPLLDLAKAMSGGSRYFVDAAHFNRDGEHFVADYLARELTRRGLLGEPVTLGRR